jgi:hypothetical protein
MSRLALAALLFSLAACASTRSSFSQRELVTGFEDGRPATRAEVDPREAAAFLERAVAVLEAEGHKVAARTDRQVVTAPRETETRCGGIGCRARDILAVYLSGNVARVEIVRAVRSRADPRWQVARDDDTERMLLKREAALLREMLGPEKVELSLR